jgi:ATP-dependent DNA helicase RecG
MAVPYKSCMNEPLLPRHRVENLIRLGESHFREFKTAWEGRPDQKRKRSVTPICREIGEALVAFANADGGELLIGVEDDGSITGVPHTDEDLAALLAAPRTHVHADTPVPLTGCQIVQIDALRVLFFSVEKGAGLIHQLPDGRCVRRKDMSTVPALVHQLQFERQEVRSREYDRQWVDGATLDELDLESLRAMADGYLRGMSVGHYLQQMGLAEYGGSGLRLRMAAVLLFARESRLRHPRSQIRILRVQGVELKSGEHYNVLQDETIQGNIMQLLSLGWARLSATLVTRTELVEGARFVPRYLYPELACREALVNALAHRDYSRENGIDAFVFDDRLEVRSPGPLLSTLAVRDLEAFEGAHESRNAHVTRVLRESRYMRELGEGIRRIFDEVSASEQARPTLYSNGTSFRVTFSNRSVFSAQQHAWLARFEPFIPTGQLTPDLKRVLVAGMDGRHLSKVDIMGALQTERLEDYTKAHGILQAWGLLRSVLTKGAVAAAARKRGVDKERVARWVVELPSNHTDAPQ